MPASAGIAVRALRAGEWEVWRWLRLACLREAPYAFGSTYQAEAAAQEASWRAKWIREPFSLRLVADMDGEPAGMCAVVPHPERAMAPQVISLWVAPAARGRGVADALLTAVIGWGRAHGHDTVYLAVMAGNDRARRAYERNGFVPAPSRTAEPGPAQPRLDMVRDLTRPG